MLKPQKIELEEIGSPLPFKWEKCKLETVSYGHGITTTPIQAAAAYAAITNGGYLINPTLVKKDIIKSNKSVISEETSNKMNKILRKVVSTEEGTATLADIFGYDVGGKTGTSKKYNNENKNINTFISIFPSQNPKYVLLVILDDPKGAPHITYKYKGYDIKNISRNEAGWNSVYITGKIIKKIGPILAINNKEIYNGYVAKNLIKTRLNYNIGKIDIRNLCLDSRRVKKGDMFFSLKGKKFNGDKFIKEAILKGAKVVICSKKTKIIYKDFPIVKVNNPRDCLTFACKKFFNIKPKNIIAVTGTNGKSSVADFFYQILRKNNKSVGTIGTLGIKRNNSAIKTSLTSPDIISLHKELYKMKKLGIDNVIIEASSHGLVQGRLKGINFKAGIFTNFSQDHLDYHHTMKNYFNSKMILFSKLLKKIKKL